MNSHFLYTIGHGTRKAEDFLSLLQHYAIKYLVDARSVPYSRFNPQYNQKTLKGFLEENGVTYVYMGDTLGGRPKEPICYDDNGKINYDILRQTDFFQEGLIRLKTAYFRNIPVAIMCSERKPENCHRSRLIANALVEDNVEVRHIDEEGQLKDHLSLKEQFHL